MRVCVCVCMRSCGACVQCMRVEYMKGVRVVCACVSVCVRVSVCALLSHCPSEFSSVLPSPVPE